MIKGIGTDIVEVQRIKSAMERQGFLERIFTPAELTQLKAKNFKAQSVAGGFAAKEAIAKALGTGIGTLSFQHMEVLRNNLGKPEVRLSPESLALLALNEARIQVSISHSKDYATAVAIWEE